MRINLVWNRIVSEIKYKKNRRRVIYAEELLIKTSQKYLTNTL